ncbi:MAG: reverse transcriptase family protein [Candidatus Thiodiazotropha sp.]
MDDTQSSSSLVSEVSNSIISLNTNSRISNSHSLNCHIVHASNDIIANVAADTSMRSHDSCNIFKHDRIRSESLSDSTYFQEISCNQVTDTQFLNTPLDNTPVTLMQSSQQVIQFSDISSDSGPGSIVQDSQQVSLSQVNEQDQTAPDNAFKLGFRDKGFRIGHLNIQGVTNKIDQLRLLLQCKENLIHIIGISETKLSYVHPDAAFEISGYQKPFRRDRPENAGGGLLMYIKDGVSCSHRPDLEHVSLECIWAEIKPTNSRSFLVGHIYRPPNSSVQWNELFEECIEKVLQEEKEIYLLGDINRDLLNNQVHGAWTDYMEPFGLTQMVSEATRVTSGSRTLIDHIYTNCPENVNSVSVPKIGLSDHFPIFLTRKMHNQMPKGNHYTISYRSFKDFDEAKFISDLQSVPWDLIKLFDDTNDILEAWTDLFLEIVDKNVPIKQHRVKHKNQPQWITPDILDAIKSRDRCKSLGNDNEYKYWRNKVTRLIKESKKVQYQTFIDNNKNNPGSIYKLFQEVGAGRGCKKSSNITNIINNGSHIEDPTEIANTFNDFFVNVASRIKEPVTNSNHARLKEFCQSKLPANAKFSISAIDKHKVLKYLSNIDVSKATGTDTIGPRLIKLAAPYIADDISFICNHSIKNSIFPNKWKEAKVSPLYKNGSHDDVNNYRPISILPILSKVLEKHVHECLSNFLHEHNLLHKTQSGFRSHHSCETALIHMIDSWLDAMDNGNMVGVVLVDFQKAFDLVDHQILLSKLELYGFARETLVWFNTYLTHRQQQVTINNCKSDFELVSCGVPQGSILGPLLFLLFINDLPLFTANVYTDLYADDTTLYDIQISQQMIEQNLQIALDQLRTWSKNNGMLLNAAKTKVMLVTTNQKRQRLTTASLKLEYMDESLQMVSSDKILGVFVDNNLKWSDHIKHITKKISSNIWLLSKIKHFLSQAHRIQFYKSYVQPHIDFCNMVWGSTCESNKLKIFRLQKRACRVILDYNVEDSHEALSSLKILSLYDRLLLRKAKFMYKVYNGLTPQYISDNFTLRNEVNTSVVLRSSASGCFVPPQPKKECFKHSMRYSGCLIWNSLPNEVKCAQTLETFHGRCLKWLTQ